MYNWNDGTDVLVHHGIKGQKWGVRRFQNPDGSLTSAGRKRYSLFSDAERKAESFRNMAREENKQWEKQRPSKNVSQSDINRWKKTSKAQEKYYDDLMHKYQNIKLGDLASVDKKTIKEAKEFVKKAFYTDSDYADYYKNGRYHNYILEKFE